jgi:hypothetical protein
LNFATATMKTARKAAPDMLRPIWLLGFVFHRSRQGIDGLAISAHLRDAGVLGDGVESRRQRDRKFRRLDCSPSLRTISQIDNAPIGSASAASINARILRGGGGL